MKRTVRDAVIERDKWCAVCGLPLPVTPAIHHRKLRKHGGSDDLSNLIALHHACHNIAPKSVHQNPRLSYENGWLVHSWAQPEEVPVLLPDGRQVLLDNKGTPIHEGDNT